MSQFGKGSAGNERDEGPAREVAVMSIPRLAGAGPVGHGTIKLGGRVTVSEPEAPAAEPEAAAAEPEAAAAEPEAAAAEPAAAPEPEAPAAKPEAAPAAGGSVGHGTIRLRSAQPAPVAEDPPQPDAGASAEPAAPAEDTSPPPQAAAAPAAPDTSDGPVGHGTIRLREPSAAPPPAAEPEAGAAAENAAPAEPAPEAAASPEPDSPPVPETSDQSTAKDLHVAYLAAASQVMAARAGADSPDGEAKLADAVAARDAAHAAWQAAGG